MVVAGILAGCGVGSTAPAADGAGDAASDPVADESANEDAADGPPADTAGDVVEIPCPATIAIAGIQASAYENYGVADGAGIDASGAQFLTTAQQAVHIEGGSGVCWAGGELIGQAPPSTPWAVMHDMYGMVVRLADAFDVQSLFVFDYGDGISFDCGSLTTCDTNFRVRGVHVRYSRDDCIEDDWVNAGTIEDSFLDGCYDGVSAQPCCGFTGDGSANVVVIRDSLIRLQPMDATYSGTVPNNNAFWKWSDVGPQLALYNVVFRADEASWESNGAGMYMAPPPGKLADCAGNTMVWLGPGPFPETLPLTFNGGTCFTLLSGTAGEDFWNAAVATWLANHPPALADAGPPIVSLFSPGISGSTTLTGTVDLTATAVDDRAIASVQLQLDGANIGPALVTENPPTKFTLSWDSTGAPNGTHMLGAVATDAAGHATVSDWVPVTVAN